MTALVVDTSALVTLQRHPRKLVVLLETAARRRLVMRVPAPALTEFLGGSPRALRGAADHAASRFRVSAVDEVLARRAAQLQRGAMDGGARRLPGPVDALVAASAEAADEVLVIDGDRADFEALAQASGAIDLLELGAIA